VVRKQIQKRLSCQVSSYRKRWDWAGRCCGIKHPVVPSAHVHLTNLLFCSLTAESDVSLMNNFRYLQPVRTVDADGEVTITSKPRSPEERRAMDGKGKTEMGEWLRQHLPLKCSTAPPLFASCSITVLSVPGDCVAWAVPPRLTVWSGAVICNCRQAATCASRRPRSLVGSTEKCRRASALRSESRSVAPCAPAAFAAKQPDNKMCACCR
jgi:hypothetical protein